MNQDNRMRKWISAWQKANAALNAIKMNELRDVNYNSNNREILNSMLQYAYDKQTVRLDSGLVTQQQIFRRIHSQSMKTSR